MDDDSDAGKIFSSKELDVDGQAVEQLVVVIGEVLLPETVVDGYEKFKIPKKTEGVSGFNPEEHTLIKLKDDEKAAIVVAKLKQGTRMNLYALYNKQDGVCKMIQLPSSVNDKNHHLFYYREWTDPDSKPHRDHKAIKTQWMKNITQFCTNYLDEHEFTRINSTPKALPIRLPPAVERRENILKSLAQYTVHHNAVYMYLRTEENDANLKTEGTVRTRLTRGWITTGHWWRRPWPRTMSSGFPSPATT
jgi:hypothetical protein